MVIFHCIFIKTITYLLSSTVSLTPSPKMIFQPPVPVAPCRLSTQKCHIITSSANSSTSTQRRLHSTSRFKYDTLLSQQIKVENRGEIKQSNHDCKSVKLTAVGRQSDPFSKNQLPVSCGGHTVARSRLRTLLMITLMDNQRILVNNLTVNDHRQNNRTEDVLRLMNEGNFFHLCVNQSASLNFLFSM